MLPPARTKVLDHRKVAAARVFAASRYPYLASALFAAQVDPTEESGTIAVDRGWQVHADPAVLDRMAVDELGRLLVHLVSHVLRDHATRAGAPGSDTPRAIPPPGTWPAMPRSTTTSLPAAWCPRVPPVCRQTSGPTTVAWRSSTTGWLEAASAVGLRVWLRRLDRPWDGEAARQGLTDRDGEFLRLAVASELQRSEGLEPGSVRGGWLRWAERSSLLDRLATSAGRRGAGRRRSSGGDGRLLYRRPSRRSESTPSVIMPTLDRPCPTSPSCATPRAR